MSTYKKRSARSLSWLLSAGLALSVVTPLAGATVAASAAAPAPVSAAPAPVLPAGLPPVVHSGSSEFAQHLEDNYIDPSRVYSTDVRWWLGEAAHTDETLLEEIQALYDSGFRGVELCMQADNAAADADYAFGSEMWTHKWNLMMNKLLDLGMGVYLTSGTNWATSNIAGLDPTSQAAMQNLTLGTGTVAPGGTLATIPAPAAASQKAGATFYTAYAYRIIEGDTIDPDSFVDLKPKVTQGANVWAQNLSWTAPTDGTYRVFGMWSQGTYQTSSPSAQPAYATNYFDTRGVAALKAYWEQHYLADPALREKILKGDVHVFMDSLEITTGNGFTWWSEDMAQQFQARKGYDIRPYLYLLVGVAGQRLVGSPYTSVKNGWWDIATNTFKNLGTYRLQDEKRREGIINDYQDVLTQLYEERMLTPLKTWLNSVGIETRAQISYGKPIEISEPIQYVDYPEIEDLNQNLNVDLYRLQTGGSKLLNKVLSSETGAPMPLFNNTAQYDLREAYNLYAAGVQRIVWHVWGAGYSYGSTAWPGHNATNFRQWGTRNPASANYDQLNAHLGRVQQFMTTGKSRTDVGFVHQNFAQGMRSRGGIGTDMNGKNWQLAHEGVFYRSTELQDNGYTYDYFSPDFLSNKDVHFDEDTKTIEQAGYKAVVLYQDWLDIAGARKILAWAKKGLKVVILENAATETPFNDGKDGALKKVTDELKTLPTVRTATVYDDIDYFSSEPGGYYDNVMEKLQELGVYPYTSFEENHQLLNQTRVDEAGNHYLYLYNYDDGSGRQYSNKEEVRKETYGKNIKTEVAQAGHFIPYSIDAFTGEVTELAGYRWEGGRTIIPVDLDYDNIALIALEKVDDEKVHIVSTDAGSSYAVADGVAVRSTESGPVTTKLSNGAVHTDTVTVPGAYDITDWDLTVQSWRPAATADLVRTETIDGLTTVNRKTSTVQTPISVELDTLKTWNNIPEIGKKVSGTGHYESTFDWDADSATGAYLDLGDTIESSFDVRINGKLVGGQVSTTPTKVKKDVGGVDKPTIDDGTGQQVPLVGKELHTGGFNWTKPIVDVSDYLVDGANSIDIDYYSVLSNVQLDRGVITEGSSGYLTLDRKYRDFGPTQAKVVPFVDVAYAAKATARVSAPAVSGTYGQATTVVAQVAGDQPSGTVTVTNGSTVLGTAPVSGGVARIALGGTSLPAGTHTLQLSYDGDATNTTSTGSVQATVAKARSNMRVKLGAKAVTPNRKGKVTVQLSANGATPSGVVAVSKKGKVLAQGTVNSSGKIVLTLRKLRVGKKKLAVSYAGNADFLSATRTITVRVSRK